MWPKSVDNVENGVRSDPFKQNSPNGPLEYMYATMYIHVPTLLLVTGGGCFYPLLGFFLNISQTVWARILKFSDF